jgi:hypothetical protein
MKFALEEYVRIRVVFDIYMGVSSNTHEDIDE